jgi:hypothetical protein
LGFHNGCGGLIIHLIFYIGENLEKLTFFNEFSKEIAIFGIWKFGNFLSKISKFHFDEKHR